MFAGRVACCPLIGLVSHGEYGDGTDGRTTNRCITLLAVNATSAVMYAFPSHRKAPSTPATMSKQQETLSKQKFDFVDATFDFLPQTATMSNEISSFRQNRNKLNMFNLFRHCRKDEISFDIVADTGNIVAENGNIAKPATLLPKTATMSDVEATFDTVEKVVQLVAFNNVASTLLLVWTRLKVVNLVRQVWTLGAEWRVRPSSPALDGSTSTATRRRRNRSGCGRCRSTPPGVAFWWWSDVHSRTMAQVSASRQRQPVTSVRTTAPTSRHTSSMLRHPLHTSRSLCFTLHRPR